MPQPTPSEPRISLTFEKFSSFVEGYASNLALGGMFLETEEQRAVGSIIDFEIKLTDGFRLMHGLGEVVWMRRVPAGPERPAGLGIRFQALDDSGRELILRILEERVRAGLERFDVEAVPEDVAMAAAGAGAPSSGGPVPEVPEPVPEVPESLPEVPEPVPEAAAAGEAATRPSPADVEPKILGEDGFTLLDSQQEEPGPGAAQTDEAFEELSFDAPWGEALPELPEEVLESESVPAAGDDAGVAQADAGVAQAEDSFAGLARAGEDLLAAVSPELAAAPDFESAAPSTELESASFAPLPEDPFDDDDDDPFAAEDPFDLGDPLELEDAGAAGAGDHDVAAHGDHAAAPQGAVQASLLLAAQAAEEIDVAPPASEALAEPDFDDIDFGVAPEDSEARASEFDADAAADFAFEPDPFDQLPPAQQPAEATPVHNPFADSFPLEEADETPPEKDETRLWRGTDGTWPPVDAGEAVGAEDATIVDAGASAFDEEPTLLTSEPLADDDEAGESPFRKPAEETFDGEDSTVAGMVSAPLVEEPAEADVWAFEPEVAGTAAPSFDSGLGTPGAEQEALGAGAALPVDEPAEADVWAFEPELADTAAPSFDSDFGTLGAEEEALGAGTALPVDEPAEADAWAFEPELAGSAAPSFDSGLGTPGAEQEASGLGAIPEPAPASLPEPPADAVAPAARTATDAVAPEARPVIDAVAPEARPAIDALTPPPPAAAAAGAAPVTVAGAPVEVQDYEDDLFAEESGAGPGAVMRQALSGRSLAAVALLLVLAVAAYFFRGPLAQWTGLGEPAADSAGPGATRPDAARPDAAGPGTQPSAAPQSTGESPAAVELGPDAVAGSGPGAARAIEEVDVSETLPAGSDVASDPAAAPGDVAPAIEASSPPLAPATSSASRVERISWARNSEGTQVTVSLDGSIDDSRYVHMPLAYNPSAEMVKVFGIDQPYAGGHIEVESPEVARIRTGHHLVDGRHEIHVVFDYPNAGPQVVSIRNLGDRLEIQISP